MTTACEDGNQRITVCVTLSHEDYTLARRCLDSGASTSMDDVVAVAFGVLKEHMSAFFDWSEGMGVEDLERIAEMRVRSTVTYGFAPQ
jgi:hypothetical protein